MSAGPPAALPELAAEATAAVSTQTAAAAGAAALFRGALVLCHGTHRLVPTAAFHGPPLQLLCATGSCLMSHRCPSQRRHGKVSEPGGQPLVCAWATSSTAAAPAEAAALQATAQCGRTGPVSVRLAPAPHPSPRRRPSLPTEVEAAQHAAARSTPPASGGPGQRRPGSSSDEAADPADGMHRSETAQPLPGRAGPSVPGLRLRQTPGQTL